MVLSAGIRASIPKMKAFWDKSRACGLQPSLFTWRLGSPLRTTSWHVYMTLSGTQLDGSVGQPSKEGDVRVQVTTETLEKG